MDAPSSERSNPGEAAVLQSMTLLATLQTATDVWEGIAGRRAGRDPSAQEAPAAVRPQLWAAHRELRRLRHQLLISRVHARRQAAREEDPLAASVRRFDDLMRLGRTARLLQRTHQRLLSLYPDVSEQLVEEARLLHGVAEALAEGEGAEDFAPRLDALLGRLRRFAEVLRQGLRL